jgi:hypothetical protein
VLFVAHDLVETHGLSRRAVGGVVTMVAIYAVIVLATRSTLAPLHDGWHLPRWARPAIAVATCVPVLVALLDGGVE